MKNPYNILNYFGATGTKIQALPQNYAFELTMATWWSAVQRARLYSDYVGLDALYSYVMKSSTIIRSAIDKRLRPLRSRTFAVYVNGKERTDLTDKLANSPTMRDLIYQRGLANFTYARVIGVDRNGETFIYPLRNLDTVNQAVRKMTYDIQDVFLVKNHVNLFWMQTSYKSEDTLGLLEPICRDYINLMNAQNNWQTASQYQAYQQAVMYYENGDEKMQQAAEQSAAQVGLGTVIVSGKSTDEISGKVVKDLELENVGTGTAADTFRIFKENIEQLRGSIMQLVLGSSLLGMSDKNTNSERLVRAHLKLFRDIQESDAIDVQDWLNLRENKIKLAYIFDEPDIENCIFKVKPLNYIDVGDVEVYVKMIKGLGLGATRDFILKSGLDPDDVTGYETAQNVSEGGKRPGSLPQKGNAKRSVANVVVDFTKRIFKRNRPVDR